MNVNELFAQALHYEDSLLAHVIYCGLKDGAVEGTSSAEIYLYDRIDLEKGYQLHKQNFLGMKWTKLFASPLGSGKFAMIFADDKQSARKVFKKEFRQNCQVIHQMDYGLDTSVYNMETKQHQTWREYRDSLPVLPAFAGIFEKDWIAIRKATER